MAANTLVTISQVSELFGTRVLSVRKERPPTSFRHDAHPAQRQNRHAAAAASDSHKRLRDIVDTTLRTRIKDVQRKEVNK